MSKEETLAKVEADLALGHIHPALQRLASLTAAYPEDLEVRAKRAIVNRQIGNLTEAGRWGYLTEVVEPAEIVAFERAFPRSWNQLLALKLRGNPSSSLGPVARARLDELAERAAAEGPAPVAWTEVGPRPTDKGHFLFFGCGVLLILGALAVFGLAIYGFLKLFAFI